MPPETTATDAEFIDWDNARDPGEYQPRSNIWDRRVTALARGIQNGDGTHDTLYLLAEYTTADGAGQAIRQLRARWTFEQNRGRHGIGGIPFDRVHLEARREAHDGTRDGHSTVWGAIKAAGGEGQ